MLWQIILQIIIIILCVMCGFAEIAVVAINDSRLEKLAAGGDKRAVRLKKLTAKPDSYMASVHAASETLGLLESALAGICIYSRLCDEVDEGATAVIAAAVSAVVLVCLLVTLTELVPKSLINKNTEKSALRISGFISAVSHIFMPAVWVTRGISGVILKIAGYDAQNSPDTVTEEEILMMSDVGAEKGTIDEDENRIIKNVFAFDDLTAEHICTHRTEVSVLWESDSIEKWEEIIHRTRHSDYPICRGSVDNVIGILDAKDYFRLDDMSREYIMKNAVREPYFVHENMKADRLFEIMRQKGADHFAVVADEYGGMSGIITVADLLEQLVGEFSDDDDDVSEMKIENINEKTWYIPGAATLGEVCEALDMELPADRYDTFGGYVIDALGEVPRDSRQVCIDKDGLHIRVLMIRHHRIILCKVKKIPPPADEKSEEKSS